MRLDTADIASIKQYAAQHFGELRAWARARMQRPPDQVIGDDYLRRWWIVPRNMARNIYVHEILHSDDDRALHDHPWDSMSVMLVGSYIEHVQTGAFVRDEEAIVTRKAKDPHRLEMPEGGRAVTLFVTGPVVRDWGFHCPQGWRHWSRFHEGSVGGKPGRGCD